MMKAYTFALFVLALSYQSLAGKYPGAMTRPVLSEKEASVYIAENYLSGWVPEAIVLPDKPDYVVKEGQSIQSAVNQAILNGASGVRTYIMIEPGRYMQTVYVPAGDVPLTIYGNSNNSEDIYIMLSISAKTTVEDYANMVNRNTEQYKEGDPAWVIYNSCASGTSTIGSGCSAVFRVESDDFQLIGVTIHNGATDAQAIALRTEADRIHLMNIHLKSFQDTLALGIDHVDQQRVLVHMSTVEGEVDYVHGGAAVVFNMVTFNTIAIQDHSTFVFAPDTAPNKKYGFLVINCNITGDASYIGSNKVHLARAWDHGIHVATDYVPDVSPNGQLVIRDSNIDNVINVEAPYAPAATSQRPFTTDIREDRDLDDNTHNRLWEYNNSGNGA